jgi:hypothetical protein
MLRPQPKLLPSAARTAADARRGAPAGTQQVRRNEARQWFGVLRGRHPVSAFITARRARHGLIQMLPD